MLGLRVAVGLLIAVIGATPSAECATCSGDCNLDGAVAPDELPVIVAAIFDVERLQSCASADRDRDGIVTAAELLGAVETLIAPDACGPLHSTWIPLAPLAAGPRQEIGVAAVDDAIYAVGGFDATGTGTALVERYSIPSDTWASVAPLPQPRNHVGAAAVGNAVYCVGGFAGSTFRPTTDVYRYDSAADTWSAVAPLPTARGAPAVAALNGQLYVVGGSGLSGSVTRHDVYDPHSNAWTQLAPLPTARNHLASVAIGEFVYTVGGRGDGAGIDNTAELDRYDPLTNTWTVLTPMPTARSGHAAAAMNGQLIVMGGEVNPANPPTFVFPQVELYDPAADAWRSLEPMSVPRHGIGAVSVGELVYVPGGAMRAGFGATARCDALQIF